MLTSGAVLIPMRDIQAAIEDRVGLYFWGRATYEDMFEGSEPHFLEFCYRLDVSGTTPDKFTLTFTHYGVHNRSDEDSQRPRKAESSAFASIGGASSSQRRVAAKRPGWGNVSTRKRLRRRCTSHPTPLREVTSPLRGEDRAAPRLDLNQSPRRASKNVRSRTAASFSLMPP